jgi:pseudaminic acid cytidylyltransferase
MNKMVAIIPARGGSKRIPKKNIKHFMGEPIISYPIKELVRSEMFDSIYVSTDDQEIASIAESYGAVVPKIRDIDLADDYTSTVKVIGTEIINFELHQLTDLVVCCVYPTTPLLNSNEIKSAITKLIKGNWDYVFSAQKLDYLPQRIFSLDLLDGIEFSEKVFATKRTQDLKQFYKDAGQFYCAYNSTWTSFKPVFTSKSTIQELSTNFAVDIDTDADWLKAELNYKSYLTKQ